MNPQTSTNPQLDLHALDVLLDSFAQNATRPQTERSEFYSDLSRQVVAATQSAAATILVKNSKGQVRVLHQHGWDKLGSAQRPLHAELTRLINTLQPSADKVASGNQANGKHQLFYSSCVPQSGMQFLYVLVRGIEDNKLAGELFQDLTAELANQIEIFENARSAGRGDRSALELTHLAQLMQNLGKSSRQTELIFHLVNDAAKICRADRVTYCDRRGRVKAISGVARVASQTTIVRQLARLARATQHCGGQLEWREGQLEFDGSRKPRGFESLAQELPSVTGFATRIEHQRDDAGVLLFEFFETSTHPVEDRERVNQLVDFVAPVVSRKLQVQAIPGLGLLDLLFNRWLVRPLRFAVTVALILGVLAAIGYWLFAIEAPFEIYGQGTLQTEQRQHVFAQVDGDIDRLLVEEGDAVDAQQPLLVIRSRDLENEIVSVQGDIEEVETELRNLALADYRPDDDRLDETRTAAEVQRLNVKLETLKRKLAFYRKKESQLQVESPLAGQVTTQQLSQRLVDRPVNRGDLLMTISRTSGEWELELEVPDNRVEFIKQAQEQQPGPLPVRFRLATDSSRTFSGTLKRIDYRAVTTDPEQPSVVRAFVSVDEQELGSALRINARVYGKIDCGTRTNFFLLTYEIQNKINRWLFQ